MGTLSHYQTVQGSALNAATVSTAVSEASWRERVARKESDEHLLVCVMWIVEHFLFKTKVLNVHIENRLQLCLFFVTKYFKGHLKLTNQRQDDCKLVWDIVA